MVRYISRHIMEIIDKESHRFQFTRLSTSYQHAQKLMQFCMHREQILVTIDLPSNANTLRITCPVTRTGVKRNHVAHDDPVKLRACCIHVC